MASKLYSADFWKSLQYFTWYRLVLAVTFLLAAKKFGEHVVLDPEYVAFFSSVSWFYLGTVLLSFVLIRWRRPHFVLQLALQIVWDIAGLSILSYASGGIDSNVNLLLLISLAAAGLVSRGKITLLFAALATMATLLQHSYAVLHDGAQISQYTRVGLLCASYFAVAWLAHALAKNALLNQQLAQRRGRDLLSMAEANRLVMRDMQDGVLVVDGQGMIKQMNLGAERLLRKHVEPGCLLSDSFPVLFGQFAYWKQHGEHDRGALHLGKGIQAKLRFVAIERNATHGAVIFLEDMQRVQAQAQQIKLAALGRLTANIAHEIRNPLSSISYAAELLREEELDESQQRLVKIVLDNTQRINHIVQDVMQLNRRDRAQPECLDLHLLLENFAEEFCLAEHLALGVLLLDGPSNIEVHFDRDHLRQVLWNLCRNAYRHGQKQAGSLKLALRQKSNGITLDIQDDGPGIAPEQLNKLFEPFFTTVTEGTGLGLYIARELCESNGAVLEYHTIEGHTGACFRITFDVADKEAGL